MWSRWGRSNGTRARDFQTRPARNERKNVCVNSSNVNGFHLHLSITRASCLKQINTKQLKKSWNVSTSSTPFLSLLGFPPSPHPTMTVEESPRWIKYRFRDVLHMWLVVGLLPGGRLPASAIPREATSRQSFLPGSAFHDNSQNKEMTFIRLSQHGADADSLQQTLLHFNFIIYSNPYHACWISSSGGGEPYLCLWFREAGWETTTLVCWIQNLD